MAKEKCDGLPVSNKKNCSNLCDASHVAEKALAPLDRVAAVLVKDKR